MDEPDYLDDTLAKDKADTKNAEEQERKRKLRELHENNTLAKLVHTYEGRAALWLMLSECHIYHENQCGDALLMAKHEGERAVGLRITQKVLTITPERYNQMREEAVRREKEWI